MERVTTILPEGATWRSCLVASPQSRGEESMDRLSTHSDLVKIWIIRKSSIQVIEYFKYLGLSMQLRYPDPGGGDLSWRSRRRKSSSWEGGTLTVHLRLVEKCLSLLENQGCLVFH